MATTAQIATIAGELGNRYSAQILKEITNPQLAAATSLDATRRDNAIQDADAYFRIQGITLDTADNMHIAVITEGTFVRLQVIAGNYPVGMWNDWKNTVRDFSLVTSRNRITPVTNSNLTPTSEDLGTKPFADLSRQRRFRGRGPTGNQQKFD